METCTLSVCVVMVRNFSVKSPSIAKIELLSVLLLSYIKSVDHDVFMSGGSQSP